MQRIKFCPVNSCGRFLFSSKPLKVITVTSKSRKIYKLTAPTISTSSGEFRMGRILMNSLYPSWRKSPPTVAPREMFLSKIAVKKNGWWHTVSVSEFRIVSMSDKSVAVTLADNSVLLLDDIEFGSIEGEGPKGKVFSLSPLPRGTVAYRLHGRSTNP